MFVEMGKPQAGETSPKLGRGFIFNHPFPQHTHHMLSLLPSSGQNFFFS